MLNAREMTKRLRARGVNNVTVNACHPGAVKTDAMRHSTIAVKALMCIFWPIGFFFCSRQFFSQLIMKDVKSGAQTPLYLALSRKLNGASGKFYSDCAELATNRLGSDDVMAKELYEYSLRATGLKI